MIRTVRHPDLSLWQSCVAETLHKQAAAQGRRLSVQSVVDDRIIDAVTQHVVGEYHGKRITAPTPRTATAFGDSDEAAYVSSLKFQMAEARLKGDGATVQRLDSECRKYATCDWDGWLSCISTYEFYKKKYKEPLYRDWKKLGKDISTYGVIEYKLPANAKVALVGDWGAPEWMMPLPCCSRLLGSPRMP